MGLDLPAANHLAMGIFGNNKALPFEAERIDVDFFNECFDPNFIVLCCGTQGEFFCFNMIPCFIGFDVEIIA